MSFPRTQRERSIAPNGSSLANIILLIAENSQKNSLYKSIGQKHGVFKFNQKFWVDFDFRSSCLEVFCKKIILGNLVNVTGNHSQFFHNSYYIEPLLSTLL